MITLTLFCSIVTFDDVNYSYTITNCTFSLILFISTDLQQRNVVQGFASLLKSPLCGVIFQRQRVTPFTPSDKETTEHIRVQLLVFNIFTKTQRSFS